MLKDKTIKVFDTDEIAVGDIITYCFRNWGDEGDKEDGRVDNGIVQHVSENEIRVLIGSQKFTQITIKNLENDEYRIIGTAKSL